MLDKRTSYLLKIINEKCKEGCFKVVTIDEFVIDFPKKYYADSDLIRQMLTALTSGGYISLKYDRDGEYCLAPTPKGREYYETLFDSHIKSTKISRLLPHVYNFLTVTFGVFIAVCLLKLFGVIC